MADELLMTLCAIIGLALLFITLPGTIELVLLTFGSLLPQRKQAAANQAKPLRLAVVVPAHNEAAGIQRCVQSLLACERGENECEVFVIADNCTDNTAELAREAGARVLERCDETRRGKGYALNYAFQYALCEDFDAFAIVDADTVVEANFVTEFCRLFAEGADAIQCRYLVNNAHASLRTRLMNVALYAFNVLRPNSRDHWGLSVGLLGNGFGLSAATLRAIPYDAVSVVEDLEYHLRLVRAQRRVRFANGTTVRADMPTGGRGAQTQRARWEGGRLRMLAQMGPVLWRDVLKGQMRLLEPLLDLLLLPLAFHVMLLLATLAVPYAPTQIYALAAFALVLLHIVTAVRVGGGGWPELAALAAAPFYILWKALLLPAMLRTARHDAEWVRTERAIPLPETGLPGEHHPPNAAAAK